MTRDEAVALVQQGLGFRGSVFKVDAIQQALQLAQKTLEAAEALPWFLIEEDQSLALTESDPTFTLPTGFLREVDDEWPHYTDSNSVSVWLRKIDFNEGVSRFASSPAAGPTRYAIRKSKLYFWPTPDTDYTLTWSYYKSAADLTTESASVWLDNVPTLIVGTAGLSIAKALRDRGAMENFSQDQAIGLAMLRGMEQQREEGGRPYAMGRNL